MNQPTGPRVPKSSLSRSAALRLAALVAVGAASAFAACSTLQSAKSPELVAGACVASAVLPLAGTAERAEALSSDLRAGKVDVQAIADATQATAAEAEALRVALEKCAAQYEAAKGGSAGAAGAISDAGSDAE